MSKVFYVKFENEQDHKKAIKLFEENGHIHVGQFGVPCTYFDGKDRKEIKKLLKQTDLKYTISK